MNYITKRIEELENERKQYNEWRENNVDAKTGEIAYFKKRRNVDVVGIYICQNQIINFIVKIAKTF